MTSFPTSLFQLIGNYHPLQYLPGSPLIFLFWSNSSNRASHGSALMRFAVFASACGFLLINLSVIPNLLGHFFPLWSFPAYWLSKACLARHSPKSVFPFRFCSFLSIHILSSHKQGTCSVCSTVVHSPDLSTIFKSIKLSQTRSFLPHVSPILYRQPESSDLVQ